jgi:hypothetical protein
VIVKNLRMNEVGAAWSLPWHALLRDLASGLGEDVPVRSAPFGMPMKVQGVDVSASSWLQRAQFREAVVQARP